MKVVGAAPSQRLTGLEPLSAKSNYFVGDDPSKWITGVSNFAQVKYEDVYRGVDLIYYGRQSKLEYDFVLAANVDPRIVEVAFEGAQSVRLDSRGDLLLGTPVGEIRQARPLVYQEVDGVKEAIPASYELRGAQQVGFVIASYDQSRPLVIDPVLSYSTYLGGTGIDIGNGITVDRSGNAYVVGDTTSLDFPTTAGAYDRALSDLDPFWGGGDVFVAKLNATGTALLYTTYIGGNSYDSGRAITVDAAANAYVTGATLSADFPTRNAFQSVYGGSLSLDAFVVKLDPTGSSLVYSTYLGGSLPEIGYGIAVNSAGNAYVVGETDSADFPLMQPIKPAKLSFDTADAFITELSPSGSALVYSTYFGGASGDVAFSVALDSTGNMYFTGMTTSVNFPTTNPFQASKISDGYWTAFVTKLNPTGTAAVYSTYLGGTYPEAGNAIAVDALGSAYVTGSTYSGNFPTTPDAFQPVRTIEPFIDTVFVTKFSPAGSELMYSTYLGAFGIGKAIAVDGDGNACVTGYTAAGFPVTPDAFRGVYAGPFFNDAFVARLNSNGTSLVYSTYFGGTDGNDAGMAIALDRVGNIYVTGGTSSAAFPVTPGALQTTFHPGAFTGDGFVAKFAFATLFDTCIQDESNGNLLQINSATGEYQFTNCAGLAVGGTGTVVRRGSLLSLQQASADQRVTATIDTSTKKASASIQLLSRGRTYSITDRDITNDACACK